MKKMPKKELDMLIDSVKKYWLCDNRVAEEDALYKRHKLSREIERYTEIDWLSISDFINSIFQTYGVYPEADNDEIYCALRCLGWEVYDES